MPRFHFAEGRGLLASAVGLTAQRLRSVQAHDSWTHGSRFESRSFKDSTRAIKAKPPHTPLKTAWPSLRTRGPTPMVGKTPSRSLAHRSVAFSQIGSMSRKSPSTCIPRERNTEQRCD